MGKQDELASFIYEMKLAGHDVGNYASHPQGVVFESLETAKTYAKRHKMELGGRIDGKVSGWLITAAPLSAWGSKKVSLTIHSTPEGAMVSENRKTFGYTPITLNVCVPRLPQLPAHERAGRPMAAWRHGLGHRRVPVSSGR